MVRKNNRSGNVVVLSILGIAAILIFGATVAALLTPTRLGGKAVSSGQPGRFIITPATTTVYPGPTFGSTIKFNTGGKAISSMALRITYPCGTSCATPNLDAVTGTGAQATTVTLDAGFLADPKWQVPVKTISRGPSFAPNSVVIDIAAIYNDVAGYTSTVDNNLAAVTFKANSAVSAPLVFDTTESVMLTKAEPVIDVLGTATGATYTVQNDTVAPSAVSNLSSSSVTTTSVSLAWTSPTDVGPTSNVATYDLRYSTTAITAANFGSATQVSAEPTPKTAGQAETYVVSSLTPNTPYYFALKSTDAAGNVSAISNVVTASTANPNSTLTFNYKLQGVAVGPIPAGYNTTATLTLKNGATVALTAPVTVSSNTSGVYAPTAPIALGNLPISASGTSYDVFIKDPTHLQKKLGTLVFNFGTNSTVPTLGGPTLKAGDFDGTGVLNALDVTSILNQYTQLSKPASGSIYDVDQNGKIELYDISYVLANYTDFNIAGDN